MFLRDRATPLEFRRTPSWLLAPHPPEEAAATLNQTKDLVLRSSWGPPARCRESRVPERPCAAGYSPVSPVSTRGWGFRTQEGAMPTPSSGLADLRDAGLLSVTAAADQAGLSPHTVRRWIARGLLPSVRLGGRRGIRPEDLAATQAVVHLGAVIPAWRQDRRQAGQRLRAVREAAGLSQIQLGARSGLTHEAISRLETGRVGVAAETVRRLAAALHVAPDQFVTREPIGLTLLTTTEAALRLEVPIDRVREWAREGRLPGTKVSGQWRVPAVAVTELVRSGRLRGRSRRLDPRYRG
jgi:excisionase family DNA binding protein